MKCRDCQKLFIPFIDDQLSVSELAEFLHHMNTCKGCREEFDVYYYMIMGMRYLDEEHDTLALKLDSGLKLHSAADYLMKYRILKTEKYLLFAILCIGMLLLL